MSNSPSSLPSTSALNSETDSNGALKILPGCWLPEPWNPGTAGSVSEQTHLIDLIPLYRTQLVRYFLFWTIIIGTVLTLGIIGPAFLSSLKYPIPDIIKLGESGLDSWLGSILMFLSAGTSYLAYKVRRQKPECLTRGRVFLFAVLIFLYLSLDRTSHCVNSIAECVSCITGQPLGDGVLFWQTIVYGAMFLALISRLMYEMQGASIAQLSMLLSAGCYASAIGCWFIASEQWQLPISVSSVSGALTLLGDFWLFWSILNYARFILLDGFGLLDDGWHIAIERYKRLVRRRNSASRFSYSQTESDSSASVSSGSSVSGQAETASAPSAAVNSSDAEELPTEHNITLSSSLELSSGEASAQQGSASESALNSSQAYTADPFAAAPVGYVPQPGYIPQPGYPYPGSYPPPPPGYAPVPGYGAAPMPSPAGYPPQSGGMMGGYPPPQPGISPVQYPAAQTPPVSVPSVPQTPQPSTTTSAASSVPITPQEVQQEFRRLEAKIHRSLTHDEKKAVIRRMLKQRNGQS